MSKQFEELSKNLAGGMSRRRAFWRFLAGIGGALLAGKTTSAGNDICVAFCRSQGLSERDFGHCVAVSAQCPPGECACIVNCGSAVCAPV